MEGLIQIITIALATARAVALGKGVISQEGSTERKREGEERNSPFFQGVHGKNSVIDTILLYKIIHFYVYVCIHNV